MARTKKETGPQQLKTGNQYIEHAKAAGANVKPAIKGFMEVNTPAGSTYIYPGDNTLDPRTRKNLNHWFRLLGLMVLVGILLIVALDFIWPYISNGALLYY